MNSQQFDEAMKGAFGMSDERYTRFIAACPGGGTRDLIDRLKQTSKNFWTEVCSEHATERAQEACFEFKDGDLLCRDGEYIWSLYGIEYDDALKAVGCRRRGALIQAAGLSFKAEVERIRDRRLGPPEHRDRIDPQNLDYGPTLGGLMDRRGDGA